MKATHTLAFILVGLAATMGQILVLRELFTVFSGSELAVAVVLAAWLSWTAVGGLLGGWISQYHRNSQPLFGSLQSLSGLILTAAGFAFSLQSSLSSASPLSNIKVHLWTR